jgi:hypothetical protein
MVLYYFLIKVFKWKYVNELISCNIRGYKGLFHTNSQFSEVEVVLLAKHFQKLYNFKTELLCSEVHEAELWFVKQSSPKQALSWQYFNFCEWLVVFHWKLRPQHYYLLSNLKCHNGNHHKKVSSSFRMCSTDSINRAKLKEAKTIHIT